MVDGVIVTPLTSAPTLVVQGVTLVDGVATAAPSDVVGVATIHELDVPAVTLVASTVGVTAFVTHEVPTAVGSAVYSRARTTVGAIHVSTLLAGNAKMAGSRRLPCNPVSHVTRPRSVVRRPVVALTVASNEPHRWSGLP
jgi:hypothetical protein